MSYETNLYVVQLPNGTYHADAGPTSKVHEAKRYATEEDACAACDQLDKVYGTTPDGWCNATNQPAPRLRVPAIEVLLGGGVMVVDPDVTVEM